MRVEASDDSTISFPHSRVAFQVIDRTMAAVHDYDAVSFHSEEEVFFLRFVNRGNTGTDEPEIRKHVVAELARVTFRTWIIDVSAIGWGRFGDDDRLDPFFGCIHIQKPQVPFTPVGRVLQPEIALRTAAYDYLPPQRLWIDLDVATPVR